MQQSLEYFSNMLLDCALVDVGFEGIKYTCYTNHVWQILDWALNSAEWMDVFPITKLSSSKKTIANPFRNKTAVIASSKEAKKSMLLYLASLRKAIATMSRSGMLTEVMMAPYWIMVGKELGFRGTSFFKEILPHNTSS
ncbi:hypothetical protein Pfo_018233 [Paulownia fortunei]|nr:hypothetical protein Pfo_018233 [Paulownia fortunei]